MDGWIKLHKQIKHSNIWCTKDTFDKRSAWIDLLLTANYQDDRFLVGNSFVDVKKGEIFTSELKLMDRWKWGRKKVRNFLFLLESENMIKLKRIEKGTIITIVNYSFYQDSGTTKVQRRYNEGTTKVQGREHKEEIKNIRTKEDNIMCKSDTAQANGLFERLWKLYPVKKGKGQVSDTAKKRLLKVGYEELERAIERYKQELEKDSDWRKPQNGSTFFNSGYVDYLDKNYVPSEHRADKRKSNSFNDFSQRDYNEKELEDYFLQEVANMGRGDSG